jgi:hypothetical protein
MEAADTYETFVLVYQITRGRIAEKTVILMLGFTGILGVVYRPVF